MKHRRDIDGLRALSVLAVIVFHMEPAALPGGYIGVDVFFVISGFLISHIITTEIDAGVFSIVGFYERRIRRIFPALFALLALVAIPAFFFLPPNPLVQYVNSAAAAAVSLSNFYFFKHSGYFDLGANELPLLHTWSLGVEEQFYLAFPLIFLGLRKIARLSWAGVLLPLIAISFSVSIVQTALSPTAAFYLPAARSWEFLSGAVIAVGMLPRVAARTAEGMAACGLALVLIATLALDPSTPYPGWAAAVPCTGAVLIIYAGQWHQTAVARLLGMPLLVAIGLISYSLYLWHWPTLVFARLLWGGSLSALQSTVVLAFVLGVSFLSWRFVEQPVRRRRAVFTRKVLYVGAAGIVAAFIGLRVVTNIERGMPQRFDAVATRLIADDSVAGPACKGSAETLLECDIGALNHPLSFAMVGDSFGGALLAGLHTEAVRLGLHGKAVVKGGCYPLVGVQIDDRDCTRVMDRVFADLTAAPEVQTVLLIGRWTAAIEGRRFGSDNRRIQPLRDAAAVRSDGADSEDVLARGMARVRQVLGERRLFVVANIPEQLVHVPMAALLRYRLGIDDRVLVSRDAVEQRQARTRRAFESRAEVDRFSILDASKILCDAQACAGTRNDRALYFDDNHLSVYGSAYVARAGLYAPALTSVR